MTIKVKAIEQHFSVVLFIMLYRVVLQVVLTFESVDEQLKCDHSYESYQRVLFSGTVHFSVFHSMIL